MTLTLNTDGLRLDAALAALLPELSRSAVQRLLEDGAVTLDGRPVRKNAKLPAGTVLNVEIPEAKPTENPAQDIPLDVVYEDDDVIFVNKPKGLVVHPAPGHPDGTLVNALIHHCGDSLSGVGGEKRPGIVHRIDKDTSGLLIAAKNDFAHAHLAAQLKDHSLARTYECIVCGNLREDSGTIDAPIGRDPVNRKRWPSPRRTAAAPSHTGRSSPAIRAIRMCAASWKRAEHTRSASTSHGATIRFSATRSTATRNLSWDKAANVFTRGS